MTIDTLTRIGRLQEYFRELGVARTVLALPAPRMGLSTGPEISKATPENLFARVVTEPEITSVAKDLFEGGYYNVSVEQSFKAVDKFIEGLAPEVGKTGRDLMQHVFKPSDPVLCWTDRSTRSQQNEQEGYMFIYAGAMAGIRNPATHEFDWIEDAKTALDLILVAQHLIRKAKEAKLS